MNTEIYDIRHVNANLVGKGYIDANENQDLFEIAVANSDDVSTFLEALGMKLRLRVENGLMIAVNMTPEEVERVANEEKQAPIKPIYSSHVMNYADSIIVVLLRIHHDQDIKASTSTEMGWIFDEDLLSNFNRYQNDRSLTDQIGSEGRFQTILSRLEKQGFIERRSMRDTTQSRISKIGLATFVKEECTAFKNACTAVLQSEASQKESD